MKQNELRIADCGLRILQNRRGFTLIEVILIIVLIGIFMAAIGMPFVSGIRESRLPEVVTTAHFLAVEKLEELASVAYDSITDETPPAPVTGFSGYTLEVIEDEIDGSGNDLDSAPSSPGSGYRRITVTVYHNELPSTGISLVTLRTDY